jgi:N-acetylglucosaminyldiphosphoundecaprenol N-acetyl-beta-D-mannosaminyltransferase
MLLNYNVFTKSLQKLDLNAVGIINTINSHSYCLARKDKKFEDALKASDLLLPDGTGIVLAAKIVHKQSIKKIAGADIHQYLLQQANLKSQKVFYLGATQSTLRLIEAKVKNKHPNITVSSFSPPYKAQFSDSETSQMLDIVNEFSPDILFVGMTAPKQEKWVFVNKDNINANTIVSIGAVFDFYAGNIKRSSDFWISIGLEWLPRFLREPKRLARRNLVSTPKFLLEIIWFKFFGRGIL